MKKWIFHRGLFLLLAPLALVGGCADNSSVGQSQLSVGESTVAEAQQVWKKGLVVMDLSFPILGEDPSYYDALASEFTLVAICDPQKADASDESNGVVGAIKTESMTAEIKSKANAGEYDRYIGQCHGPE